MANNAYRCHTRNWKAIIIDPHIHEGLWTLNVNFDVEASHAPRVHDPTLTVMIKGIVIMRAPPTDPFAVDAALVNPTPAPRAGESRQLAQQANGSRHRPNSEMQFSP